MRVAGEAARVYVEAREAGENDVGRLLMKIGGRQRLENKGHAQENDVYSREHSGGTHARMLFGGPKGSSQFFIARLCSLAQVQWNKPIWENASSARGTWRTWRLMC